MKNSLHILILALVLWACANRIQPTGGPKDVDPPKLVNSLPADGQRNFISNQIILNFDEYITLKSLKEQLLITPRIESEYDFKYRKRSVFLNFTESFADSTTYTLNFRDGIVDITEGLPAKDLQIAFSTGSLLDTLEINGNVVDMMTKVPLNDITIGLYTVDDTLDIFTGPPYYFAKTNKQGDYHFRNIKDGQYKIYAFQDGNKNLTCETNNESYGFLAGIIELDSAYEADTIALEHLNLDTLKLTRTRASGKYVNVLANKYLVEANLRSENDSLLWYHYTDDHDGLIVYNTFDIQDSVRIYTTLRDSIDQVVEDTFYLKFPETSRRPAEFKISSKEVIGSLSDKLFTGELHHTKPLLEVRPDSIIIKQDTISTYPISKSFFYSLDTLEQTLTYSFELPQQVVDSILARKKAPKEGLKSKSRAPSYQVEFKQGAFMSIEEDTSSTLSKTLKFIDPTKGGLVSGRIATAYKSYIIQLIDSKFNLIQESINEKEYTFRNIPPGQYYLRILIDSNENGAWDHSDIRSNRPAEPVLIYKDDSGTSLTAVRANWEITVDLAF